MSTSPPITVSPETLKAWKASQRETLKNFTDAATQRLVKEIVDFEREVKRQQELQEAKFSAGMTKLEYRIEAAADLERRLAERLATLKNGGGFTLEDVEPLLRNLVNEAMAKRPVPRDGRDGTDGPTLAAVRVMVAELVAEAFAQSRQQQPEAKEVRHWTPRPTGWPHNPNVIDVEPEVEVDHTPQPLRIEHLNEAVKLLRIASGRGSTGAAST